MKRSWRVIRSDPVLFTVSMLVLAWLIIFAIYPIVRVFLASVQGEEGFDLGFVFSTLFSSSVLTSLGNSLLLGFTAGVGATLIGFAFAFAVARTTIPGKKVLHALAMIPIIAPPFVIGLSTIILFGRSGFVTKTLLGLEDFDVYGFGGLAFIQIFSFAPIAYLNLRGMLESIDSNVEDASAVLGAGRGRTFRKVLLPLAMPAVLSALLLVFVKSIEDFGNPILIGGNYNTLVVDAYMQITGMFDMRTGSLLAITLLLPALLAFSVQRYWSAKTQVVTVTGKPTSVVPRTSEPHIVWPLFGVCAVYGFFVVALYGAVVAVSVTELWGIRFTLTLEHFAYVFTNGFTTIGNSLTLSLIAAPLTTFFGVAIAYFQVRRRFPGRRLMDISTMLAFGVPGTVTGIGFVLAFNEAPWYLTGTAAIIVFALVVRNVQVAIEASLNSLRQVDPALEEASAVLGANSLQTFFRIALPLLRQAIFTGLIYSFVRSMTSISAIVFLVSVNWNVLTTTVLSQVEQGRLGIAAAYCVVLIVIVLVAMGGFSLLANKPLRFRRRGGANVNG